MRETYKRNAQNEGGKGIRVGGLVGCQLNLRFWCELNLLFCCQLNLIFCCVSGLSHQAFALTKPTHVAIARTKPLCH